MRSRVATARTGAEVEPAVKLLPRAPFLRKEPFMARVGRNIRQSTEAYSMRDSQLFKSSRLLYSSLSKRQKLLPFAEIVAATAQGNQNKLQDYLNYTDVRALLVNPMQDGTPVKGVKLYFVYATATFQDFKVKLKGVSEIGVAYLTQNASVPRPLVILVDYHNLSSMSFVPNLKDLDPANIEDVEHICAYSKKYEIPIVSPYFDDVQPGSCFTRYFAIKGGVVVSDMMTPVLPEVHINLTKKAPETNFTHFIQVLATDLIEPLPRSAQVANDGSPDPDEKEEQITSLSLLDIAAGSPTSVVACLVVVAALATISVRGARCEQRPEMYLLLPNRSFLKEHFLYLEIATPTFPTVLDGRKLKDIIFDVPPLLAVIIGPDRIKNWEAFNLIVLAVFVRLATAYRRLLEYFADVWFWANFSNGKPFVGVRLVVNLLIRFWVRQRFLNEVFDAKSEWDIYFIRIKLMDIADIWGTKWIPKLSMYFVTVPPRTLEVNLEALLQAIENHAKKQ
eukprot:jgi/Botrbrau1/13183/Bobra.242_1s0013.1